jgi:predicted tellurium resistance membrane protein TerC
MTVTIILSLTTLISTLFAVYLYISQTKLRKENKESRKDVHDLRNEMQKEIFRREKAERELEKELDKNKQNQ